MKVLNIGSLNLDYVYSVDHIVTPGETQATVTSKVFAGGKGLNQSVAMAKAGVKVFHSGIIGEDGKIFLEVCDQYGIDTRYIKINHGRSGHAIIQVDKDGQNSILLYGGTNQSFTEEYVDEVLTDFQQGDLLVLQNEVNKLSYIINRAYKRDMTIVLNPSPFNAHIEECELSKVSIFLMNEIEGEQITGEKQPDKIIEVMREKYPDSKIVLTLGSEGAIYSDKEKMLRQDSYKVNAVDTTAAGDTFTGYFIAGLIEGMDIKEILAMSAKAASITVTRDGAVESIPTRKEIN